MLRIDVAMANLPWCGLTGDLGHSQVERAVRDGYDVRGLMYWTLVDNFEVTQTETLHMLLQQTLFIESNHSSYGRG